MLYTYSESQSDLESETNFQQQPTSKINNKNKFVRNNSIKANNLSAARRRASECSSYYGTADNISFYSAQLAGQNRGSITSGGATAFNSKPPSLRRAQSSKSAVSTTSGDVSNSSGSSTCSDGETTSSSSGQPNLPYPGFVEYSFKWVCFALIQLNNDEITINFHRYLNQEARPRTWCLCLITNPYPFQRKIYYRQLFTVIACSRVFQLFPHDRKSRNFKKLFP